jgi:hypothetical protein
LIPIASNPDGSWGTFRIPPERTWMEKQGPKERWQGIVG